MISFERKDHDRCRFPDKGFGYLRSPAALYLDYGFILHALLSHVRCLDFHYAMSLPLVLGYTIYFCLSTSVGAQHIAVEQASRVLWGMKFRCAPDLIIVCFMKTLFRHI